MTIINLSCFVSNCPNKYKARGFCNTHYKQWLKTKNYLILPTGFERLNGLSVDSVEFAQWFWMNAQVTAHPDRCWIWQKATNEHGYGVLGIKGKPQLAHRIAWQLTNGRPAQIDLKVLHSCDNPPCCNPNHLREGTHQDNVDDREGRGRWGGSIGEAHPQAVLTVETVRQIKYYLAQGDRLSVISKKTGATVNSIYPIKKGKTWKHVQI